MSKEAIAGLTAAGVALFGIIAGGFSWLLVLIRSENRGLGAGHKEEVRDLREDNATLREDNTQLREELLTEIREGNQRILEALYYHRHDPYGPAAFCLPSAAD